MPGIWSLKSKLILRCLLAIILAALLFLPAGDLNFWQGWVYMAVFSIPMIRGSVYFYRYDPELVERRMQTREKVREQRLTMKLANLIFVTAFLLPGLDHRLG